VVEKRLRTTDLKCEIVRCCCFVKIYKPLFTGWSNIAKDAFACVFRVLFSARRVFTFCQRLFFGYPSKNDRAHAAIPLGKICFFAGRMYFTKIWAAFQNVQYKTIWTILISSYRECTIGKFTYEV